MVDFQSEQTGVRGHAPQNLLRDSTSTGSSSTRLRTFRKFTWSTMAVVRKRAGDQRCGNADLA